jgi:hypothetical protein
MAPKPMPPARAKMKAIKVLESTKSVTVLDTSPDYCYLKLAKA